MKAIEDLKAALAAATQGEWETSVLMGVDGPKEWTVCMEGGGDMLADLTDCPDEEANARLIALMHNALPALNECVEALNAIYNRIPTSAIPSEFIGGEGNWGLTEEENALAVIAATALAKLENNNA